MTEQYHEYNVTIIICHQEECDSSNMTLPPHRGTAEAYQMIKLLDMNLPRNRIWLGLSVSAWACDDRLHHPIKMKDLNRVTQDLNSQIHFDIRLYD